jgi:hypothetical protein
VLIVSPGGVWMLRRCGAVLRLRWQHPDSTCSSARSPLNHVRCTACAR